MRVNSKVFAERTDLFQDLFVKDCPSQFATEANRLLNMCVGVGYSPPKSYNTMSELYKKLTLDYWKEYNDFDISKMKQEDFDFWFIHCADEASNIERAIRWLAQHNYFLIDETVLARAEKAASNFRNSVRG